MCRALEAHFVLYLTLYNIYRKEPNNRERLEGINCRCIYRGARLLLIKQCFYRTVPPKDFRYDNNHRIFKAAKGIQHQSKELM